MCVFWEQGSEGDRGASGGGNLQLRVKPSAAILQGPVVVHQTLDHVAILEQLRGQIVEEVGADLHLIGAHQPGGHRVTRRAGQAAVVGQHLVQRRRQQRVHRRQIGREGDLAAARPQRVQVLLQPESGVGGLSRLDGASQEHTDDGDAARVPARLRDVLVERVEEDELYLTVGELLVDGVLGAVGAAEVAPVHVHLLQRVDAEQRLLVGDELQCGLAAVTRRQPQLQPAARVGGRDLTVHHAVAGQQLGRQRVGDAVPGQSDRGLQGRVTQRERLLPQLGLLVVPQVGRRVHRPELEHDDDVPPGQHRVGSGGSAAGDTGAPTRYTRLLARDPLPPDWAPLASGTPLSTAPGPAGRTR